MTKVQKQKTADDGLEVKESNRKQKSDKYWDAEDLQSEVEKILSAYPERFVSFRAADIKFLFKAGKDTTGKKHVALKLIKEPYTHLTTKKLIMVVTEEWWDNNIDSDRTKALIESLCSIQIDQNGDLKKRSFDVQTFAEFVKGGKLDFSKFSKILPAEKAKEELVLTAQ